MTTVVSSWATFNHLTTKYTELQLDTYSKELMCIAYM